MLIGLYGHAKSGKSTVAAVLAEAGFREHAFANKLKDVVADLFQIPRRHFDENALKEAILPGLGKSPRQLMQMLGQFCRGVDDNVWVNLLRRDFLRLYKAAHRLSPPVFTDDVCISDVRHKNEMRYVQDCGGKLWKIVRPGKPRTLHAGHISETALDLLPESAFDAVLVNDGPLGTLREKAQAELCALRERGGTA